MSMIHPPPDVSRDVADVLNALGRTQRRWRCVACGTWNDGRVHARSALITAAEDVHTPIGFAHPACHAPAVLDENTFADLPYINSSPLGRPPTYVWSSRRPYLGPVLVIELDIDDVHIAHTHDGPLLRFARLDALEEAGWKRLTRLADMAALPQLPWSLHTTSERRALVALRRPDPDPATRWHLEPETPVELTPGWTESALEADHCLVLVTAPATVSIPEHITAEEQQAAHAAMGGDILTSDVLERTALAAAIRRGEVLAARIPIVDAATEDPECE